MNTQIWQDNWLLWDYKLRPICAISASPSQFVSELIVPVTRTWDKQPLMEYFIILNVDVSMNIPLSSRVQQDFFASHYDKKEIVSIWLAYRMISGIKHQREDWLEHGSGHSNQAEERKSWTHLWKVKIPSKVWDFVWRLSHMSLPMRTTHHERMMATSPTRSICNSTIDTWRQSLFECRLARCLWALGDEEVLKCLLSNQVTMHAYGYSGFWIHESTWSCKGSHHNLGYLMGKEESHTW